MTTNDAAELEADYANATNIVMTDENNQVTIKSSGTYVISGECSDGNITVKKGTTDVVLVLADLDLTSTAGATVSINKEAEVKVAISGEVVLTDNENPDDENSADEAVADAYDGAALKAKANSQVCVTGDGTLTINGNAKNGVKASIDYDGELYVSDSYQLNNNSGVSGDDMMGGQPGQQRQNQGQQQGQWQQPDQQGQQPGNMQPGLQQNPGQQQGPWQQPGQRR